MQYSKHRKITPVIAANPACMVVVGYTPRGADRHIFSAGFRIGKANEREKARIAPHLEI